MVNVSSLTSRLFVNIASVVVGNAEIIQRVIECFISGSHVLLEDNPGKGKTVVAKTAADSFGMKYSRVQGVPDLMPSDITGANVWLPKEQEFDFRPGPIFSNVVVADEINRMHTKTQAAFLEAMQENVVSVDGLTRSLPDPFFVIATQNPLESEGVFPLSEANIDRFAVRIPMEEMTVAQLAQVLDRTELGDPRVSPVLDERDFKEIRREYEQVRVSSHVKMHVAELIKVAQQPERLGYKVDSDDMPLYLGDSVRPAQDLIRLSKAAAVTDGDWYVSPRLAHERLEWVLAHRLRGEEMTYASERKRKIHEEFIPRLLEAVPYMGVSEGELMEEASQARNN